MRILPVLGLLAVGAVAACSNGTYLVVSVDKSADVPDTIASLHLALTVGGKSASTTVSEPGGGTVRFPTDAALRLANADGPLSLLVEGRDGAGNVVAHAVAQGVVSHGATLRLAVALGGAGDGTGGNGTDDLGSGSPVLTLDPVTKDFGTVVVGSASAATSLTLSNSGTAPSGPLTVGTTGDAGDFAVDGCNGSVLMVGDSCAITVRYAPKAAGKHTASVVVSGAAGATVSAALNGTAVTPGSVSVAPASFGFNAQLLNTTATHGFTVTNGGGVATGALGISFTGSDAVNFAVPPASDSCSGHTLAPGASCSVTAAFTPTTAGPKSASLTVSASPGGTGVAAVTGSGVTAAGLAFDFSGYDFSTVDVAQQSASFTFTLSNAGGQATGNVTSSVTGNSADFSVSDNCAGKSLGAACTYVVKLTPQAYGSKSATVTASASPGGARSFTVTGVGRDSVTLGAANPGAGGSITSGTTINCGAGNSTCSTSVTRTTSAPSVTLAATAASGYTFAGWGGDCASAGSNASCTLTMSQARSVSASFTQLATQTLTVNYKSIAGRSIRVTSSDGKIDCGQSFTKCSASYTGSPSVTLTPNLGTGDMIYWFGDCSGSGACGLTMNASHSASITVRPGKNLMFVSSQSFSTPQMNGVSNSDGLCQTMANNAQLGGHYAAYLSSETVSAQAHLQSFNGNVRGWVRVDGMAFGDTFAALNASGALNPPKLDENGADQSSAFAVRTGTSEAGAIMSGNTCGSWTSTTGDPAVGNMSTTTSWSFTFVVSGACQAQSLSHIYCMQTDLNVPVP